MSDTDTLDVSAAATNVNPSDPQLSKTRPHPRESDTPVLSQKDFNSSTDTYASENNDMSEDRTDGHEASFDRNFDLDNTSDSDSKVIKTVKIDNDEFSFVHANPQSAQATPKGITTTVSVNNPNPFSSPSKSSLKKTTSNSPKKNVVFTTSVPQVIHYPQNADSSINMEEDPEKEEEDRQFSNQIEQTLNHHWNQVRQASVSSEDTPPPVPPPHSIDLNSLNYEATEDTDMDQNTLKEFKLHSKNLNNLSLNEKLDIFLNNQNALGQDDRDQNTTKELDQHLQDLHEDSKNRLESNIHHLSLDLQNKLGNKVENPLNSLTKSSEVPLRSAGSSQSSLQSLLEDNRMLPSKYNDKNEGFQGIQLNDGIHGFSNDLVEQLIPQSRSAQLLNSDESQLLSFNTNPNRLSKQSLLSENDEFHDSFDNEYKDTEQSIMDLLSSAAMNQHTSTEKNPIVKEEPIEFQDLRSSEPNERQIKQSPSMADVELKGELDEISPKEVSQDIKKPVLRATGSDDEIEQYNDSFEEEKVSNFRIGDHIENGWKYEDSLDADREDNDEFTNNDVTILSHLNRDEDEIDPESDDIEPASDMLNSSQDIEPLEVNLSPDTSQSIEDSPDRVSLAPPRSVSSMQNSPVRSLVTHKGVDIGIDATVPPTPVRLAREAKLREKYASVSPVESRTPTFKHESTSPGLAESKLEMLQAPNTEKSLKSNNESVTQDEVDEVPIAVADLESVEAHEDETLVNQEMFSVNAQNSDEGREAVSDIDESTSNTDAGKYDSNNEKPQDFESKHNDSEILANSTNIPPEELTLPPIEPGNYSSFEEITKTLNNSKGTEEDSFEQSLSAEFDEDKPTTKTTSYLSIWHLQNRIKPKRPIPTKSVEASDITIYDPNTNSYRVPSALLNKRIKDVNVVSRKVVDPNEVEYDEDFLPELSQDSGFEKHFNSLINVSANDSKVFSQGSAAANRLSNTPLSDRNILTNIEAAKSEESLLFGPKAEANQTRLSKPPAVPEKPITQINQKRSRFRVPSIDIKRSITLAEQNKTRDKYDDIFKDSVALDRSLTTPTIKGHGMKTLPSMDKDDVKKILNTKRMISHEEYSQVKLVGRKSSIVHDNSEKYDSLQQQASIHNAADNSMDSSPLDNDVMPHLASELMKVPQALLSKEQVFNDSDLASSKLPNSNFSSRISSAVNKDINVGQSFPEPDADILSSPSNIFKTPPKDDAEHSNDGLNTQMKDKENRPPNMIQKGKPGSPIKIKTSPIKVVKRNSGISIVVQSPPPPKLGSLTESLAPPRLSNSSTLEPEVQVNKVSGSSEQFSGSEISNIKLRKEQSPYHEKQLSVVSVPSMYTTNTNVTQPSRTSSNTLLNQNNGKTKDSWKQHSVQSSVIRENDELLPVERGRLFFRVVGLKNINLPDIQGHDAEFSVTLDNGVHCIKTPNYKVDDRRVLIGKEFELTVGDSLEFILTMKMNYEKPKGKLVEVQERRLVKSKSRLSRMFGSKEVITTTKFVAQDPVDSWKTKFAQDGSFGRCYIDFDQYESKISYNTNSFDIPCFNEWEIIQSSSGPIKAKPYVIGNLEVKMLFIPRSEMHEALPTSIRSASEVISQLLNENQLRYEGYLTQDGGDCESLKRRFFKLEGTSLIAHSEFNHKTRAKINLAKIIDVIFVDRNRPETAQKARNFSDILLVPDSFKIKFANGEIIDFGAANNHEKYQWISYFETIAQHNRFRRLPWVKAMLEQAKTKTNNPWFTLEGQ
ncbi:Bud site selection protein bud4 [Yamadazyma tenuis]|uniref:Bud site selection protein bud4 n=1 Tax=Candida tenuis TaxID=2315449 RepID=UPI0027AB8C87|nr:Bud site selection protein bud4 [Yamadazyma tenuis]